MQKIILALVLLFPAVSYAAPISEDLQTRLDKYVCSVLDRMVPADAKAWRKNADVYETAVAAKNTYEATLYIYPTKAELRIVSFGLMSIGNTYTSTHKCSERLHDFLFKWETAYLDKFLKDEGIE